MLKQNQEDYVLFITNVKQDTTFGVPMSLEELTTIIHRLPLLDKREGTYYDGITGVIEAYFDAIKLDSQTTLSTQNYE